MSATQTRLRRILARQNTLVAWGTICSTDSVSGACISIHHWRSAHREFPDFHADQTAIVQLSEIDSSNSDTNASTLRRYKDLLPTCIFVGDDRVADELDRMSRAFPDLQIAASHIDALKRRRALVLPARALEKLDAAGLDELLERLDGLPLVLLTRPDSSTLNLIQNRVRDQDVVVVPDQDPAPIPILFLHAQAAGLPPLDIDSERSGLARALPNRMRAERATTLKEIDSALSLYRPLVLHFAGHGNDGRLWLEGTHGLPHQETGDRLARLILSSLGPEQLPELIVLNACETDAFIESVSRICRHLVVMRHPISNAAATAFSSAFYGALRDPVTADIQIQRLPEALESGRAAMRQIDPSFSETAFCVEGKAPACLVSASPTTPSGVAMRGTSSTTVTVWWGTDRKRNDPDDPTLGFGTTHDSRLHVGRIDVQVDRGPFGTIAGGLLRRPRVRALSGSLQEFDTLDTFSADLTNGLSQWRRQNSDHPKHSAPELLLFVHGYNVGFEEAARRAAQIHVDLAVPGITALYSWASADRLLGYAEDETAAVRAFQYLQIFIEALLKQSDVARFHLLAHSMGNRVLLRALENVAKKAQNHTQKPFGQIFLCAPDVRPDLFHQVAAEFPKVSERTTLYISRRDKALWLSKIFHGADRIGFYPEITHAEGTDTIATEEVSGALLGLGHGYYAGTDALLYDIGTLIDRDRPPGARQRLQLEPGSGQPRYYSFKL